MLAVVILITWLAINITRGRIGRMWMAVRDMDIAAEIMGIKLLRAKLLGLRRIVLCCGVAGALFVFLWRGGGGAGAFRHPAFLPHPVHGHHRRARARSSAIILGALLIVALPVILGVVPPAFGLPIEVGGAWSTSTP